MYSSAFVMMLAAATEYFRSLNPDGPELDAGPTGWVWPMPVLRDRRMPVISDGWGSGRDGNSRKHRGVDVMYKRPARVSLERAKAEHGSIAYEVPNGTPVLAARAGKVWSLGHSEYGHSVILDHGKPWATFYQHLQGHSVRKGDLVRAGQVLGLCGHGEKPGDGGIRHLHFAVWKGGGEEAAIDPQAMMGAWQRLGPL